MQRNPSTLSATDPFLSDQNFDRLYPASVHALASRHWTPLRVAQLAAEFLAITPESRILDIGSGPGKFCLAAAHFQPGSQYFGIEQRSNLVAEANRLKDLLQKYNVRFLHGNFTRLDFEQYDHFYFYNAFYENLRGTEKIDQGLEYTEELYHYYNRQLFQLLDQKPSGTRLATFHSLEAEIPPAYHEVGYERDGLLKFWIKV